MALHTNTEDLFKEFFSNVRADNYPDKVAELRSDILCFETCMIAVEELSRMTDQIATAYLEDEANSDKFMDRYHLSSYCEYHRDFMFENPLLKQGLIYMRYPERDIETLQKLIFEVAQLKVIKKHSESLDLPLTISSFYVKKEDESHNKQVFKPSLPYVAGSVIAIVELIVVCKSLDLSQKKNYIFWNFEGCLSDEAINWKTRQVYLVR